MKSLFFILFLIAFLSSPAFPQKPTDDAFNARLIFDKDQGYAFNVTAPKGWLVDDEASRFASVGFYPAGDQGKDAKNIMYVNVLPKDKMSFEETVKDELDFFKKSFPRLKITAADPLPIRNGQNVQVKYLARLTGDRHESVAYIDEEKVVVMIVLSAQTTQDFDKYFDSFKELVASYFFISNEIVIRKPDPKTKEPIPKPLPPKKKSKIRKHS